MKVVRAVPEDARSVADIHVRTWRAAFSAILPADFLANLSVEQSETMWSRCIASGTPELIVAKDAGAVRGWLSFGPSRDGDANASTAEIWAFYVAPEAWSSGVSRSLWIEAERLMLRQQFQSCSLWVFPQNLRAIGFYSAAGFVLDPRATKTALFGSEQVSQVRYVTQLLSDEA